MEFLVSALTRCAGNNHYRLTLVVNGQSHILTFMRDDLAIEPDEVRDGVLARVRSAVKEAGATTFAQAQTALVTKTFRV